jgi:hypothetical protein
LFGISNKKIKNHSKMATSLVTSNLQSVDREKIYLWITELTNPETRESALFELRYNIRIFLSD